MLEHGIETGIIKRLPHGAYIELHQPLGPVDEHGHPIPLEYQGAAVPKRMNKLGSAGAPGTGSFLTADPASEDEALTRGRARLGTQGADRVARTPGRANGSSNGEHEPGTTAAGHGGSGASAAGQARAGLTPLARLKHGRSWRR